MPPDAWLMFRRSAQHSVDIDRKVGAAAGAESAVTGDGLKSQRLVFRQRLANRGQVEGERFIGVQRDHRMPGRGVVDSVDPRGVLRQNLPRLDVVPALAIGGRSLDYDSRRADWAGTVGHRDSVDKRNRRAREDVDLQAGQDAELAAAGRARTWIDSTIALTAAKTVATCHHIGQVERHSIHAAELGLDARQGELLFSSAPRALFVCRRPQRAFPVLDSREHRRHAVIVALGKRIELVIVAASAIEREPQRGGGDRIDDVVEFVSASATAQVAGHGFVPDLVPGPRAQESQSRDRLRIVGIDHVAGNLLAQKLIEWLVMIERIDDVVAISPGMGAFLVAFEAVCIGIMDHVEPVAAPTLAIVGRCQKSIDDFFKRIGRRVGQEGVAFLGSGRQADQVERRPA